MKPVLSAELLLVAACCQWPPNEARNAAIERAAAKSLDWDSVLREARQHRVEGLVRNGLREAGIGVPERIASVLTERTVALGRQSLVNASEEIRLSKALSAASLPFLFVKGTTLAMRVYKTLGLKTSWDIDLLVSGADIHEACALLSTLGYERKTPDPALSDLKFRRWMAQCKETLWINPSRGAAVEIHIALMDNTQLLRGIGLASPRQEVRVADGIVLPTLADAELFSYLCVHGTGHHWTRLKWLADAAALLSATGADPQRMYRQSVNLGAGRSPAVALLLCNRLLGLALPPQFVDELRGDWAARWLESMALEAIALCSRTEFGREAPAHIVRMMIGHFLMKKGWRHSAAELRHKALMAYGESHLAMPVWLRFPYTILLVPRWFLKRIRLSRS
jgi:hypothetical protein